VPAVQRGACGTVQIRHVPCNDTLHREAQLSQVEEHLQRTPNLGLAHRLHALGQHGLGMAKASGGG
jgi:hypothetical protein